MNESKCIRFLPFNSSFHVRKIEHTSVRFDLTAIVFKKKKDIGVLAAFKLNMSQQYSSFPLKLKQSEVAFTKNDAQSKNIKHERT